MATSAPRRTNRNGVRPKYMVLGTDGEGAEHLFRTTDRAVIVVRDGERELNRCLAADGSLDNYMAHVASRRGWERRKYGRSLGAILAEGLEVA